MDDPKKLIKFDKEGDPVAGDPAKRIGDGFRDPEGYFDDFVRRMEPQLPRREEVENPLPVRKPTLWTRMRPYTYMAAMFCGIWLMLQLFGIIANSNDRVTLSIDPDSDLGKAVADERFVNEFVIDDVSNWDILDTLACDSAASFSLADSLYNAAVADGKMDALYAVMDDYFVYDEAAEGEDAEKFPAKENDTEK